MHVDRTVSLASTIRMYQNYPIFCVLKLENPIGKNMVYKSKGYERRFGDMHEPVLCVARDSVWALFAMASLSLYCRGRHHISICVCKINMDNIGTTRYAWSFQKTFNLWLLFSSRKRCIYCPTVLERSTKKWKRVIQTIKWGCWNGVGKHPKYFTRH